jgi:glutamate--cysteine ligase
MALDPERTGPPVVLGPDPAREYARRALDTRLLCVRREDDPDTSWAAPDVSFAEWIDGRLDPAPTRSDLDYHLTTLFPPVRPRRFLEIRYLDSVPDADWPALVFTLATLLDDPAAADVAAEATEPVATAWDRAAQIGLGDRRLHHAAIRCVQAAADRVPVELEESMGRLLRSVQTGRCPADDFSDRVVRSGIATAVTEQAQGEM